MIELKPITLQALALGVAAIVLASLFLEGEAALAVSGVGTFLIGLVLRGPGLVTQSQARREVERASKAPPAMPAYEDSFDDDARDTERVPPPEPEKP